MPLIGAGLRLARGLKRATDLPDMIAELEEHAGSPLLTEFEEGIPRFEAAELLLNAKLTQNLEQAPDEELERVFEQHLDALEQEFQMAKEELEQEPASRADVVALGITMKQMAFTYDQELEAFDAAKRQEFDTLEEQFREWTEERQKEGEAKLESWMDEFTSEKTDEVDQRVEVLEKRIDRYMSAKSRKFQDLLEESEADARKRLEDELARFEKSFGGRISNTEEQLEKLANDLPGLKAQNADAAAAREEMSKQQAELREQLQEQEDALTRLDNGFESRVSSAEKRLEKLANALPGLKAQNADAAAAREEISKRQAELREQLEAQDDTLARLDDDLKGRVSSAEERLRKLTDALPDLETQDAHATAEREELSKRQAELRKQLEEQQDALSKARSRNVWMAVASVVAILVAMGSLGLSLMG